MQSAQPVEIPIPPCAARAFTVPPGASLELRAEMECLAAVSACSAPRTGRANAGQLAAIIPPEDRP